MRQKTRRFIVSCMVVVAVIVGICSVLLSFQDQLDRLVREESYRSLKEVSRQSVDLIYERIEGDRRSIRSVADLFGRSPEPCESRFLQECLVAETEHTHFSSIVFADMSGAIWTLDGPSGLNISGQDYFQEALTGDTVISDVILSIDTVSPVLVIASPVYREGRVVGVIAGRYLLEALSELLTGESFDGRGYGYLVTGDGSVLVRSKNAAKDVPDLKTILQEAFSTDDISRITSDMSAGVSGTLAFRLDGQNVLAVYAPVGIDGWYLMTLAPQELIGSRSMNLFQLALRIFILSSVLLTVMAVCFFWLYFRDRKRLIQANHDMSRFSDILPGGICRFRNDEGWTIVFANEGFFQLVGYSEEELSSRFQGKLSALVYPADIPRLSSVIQTLAEKERSTTEDIRLVCSDGSLKWIWFNAELGSDEGDGDCIHSTFVNISSLKQVQEQLQVTKRRYDLVLDQTEDIIFDWNVKSRAIYLSHTFRKKLGYDPVAENFPESAVLSHMIDERDVDSFLDIFNRVEQGLPSSTVEIRIKNVTGDSIWFRAVTTAVFDAQGAPVRAVGTLQDINTQKQTLQKATDSAGRDSLTQLYNRRMTTYLVESQLGERSGTIAFAVIDIDDFKLVNDSMGHLYGDVVLSEMARVLLDNCSSNDIVGRLGGDEFCIFFPDVDTEETLRHRAAKVLDAMYQFGRNNALEYELSASMGIVVYPPGIQVLQFEKLFQKADMALYYAKRQGKNRYAFYSEQIEREASLGRNALPVVSPTKELEPQGEQKNFRENLNDYFFKIFLEYANVEKAILVLLDMVGKLFGTGRVFICEYDPGTKSLSNTFEWCNVGIPSVKERYRRLPVGDCSDLTSYFDESNIFFCPDVEKLDDGSEFHKLIKGRDCVSILLCLITDGSPYKAVMGFEQCDVVRYPSKEELNTLSQLAKIICRFLLRDREQQRMSSLLLNRIGGDAYVIDMADYHLVHVSGRMAEKYPDAVAGACCYQAIRGSSSPCADCPLRTGPPTGNERTVLAFPDGSLVAASFSPFYRQNKNLCLVCCDAISRYGKQMLLPTKGRAAERSLLVDVLDEIVYVSDPATYELLYVNRAGRTLLGVMDTDYIGCRCYEVLQHRTSPCPFCTNGRLSYDDFYIWEHTNVAFNRHYLLKDKLIDWEGRPARIEFAVDVTVKENVSKALSDKLDKSQVVIDCIGALITAGSLDDAAHLVLEKLGLFYNADRTFIFELDAASKTVSNTYEWLAAGVPSQLETLQRIPLTSLRRWMVKFNKRESLSLADISKLEADDLDEYVILKERGVRSLYAAPFFIEDKLVGFIGMVNPSSQDDDWTTFDSLSYFVIEEILKRRMQKKLHDIGYLDALTGLPNRSAYVRRLAELEHEMPDSVGVLVADINGLKQTNMDYGHAYGDELVKTVGKSLSRRFAGYGVFRLDGDEFVIICERISQNKFVGLVQKLRNDLKDHSVSVGHTWSKSVPDIEMLIVHADELMNIEKQEYYRHVTTLGKHYDPIRYENLVAGLERGAFLMYLQPKEVVSTGRLCGAEALCRYWSEETGLVAPNRFIPTLEKERLIKYVDLYMFEQVCKLLDRWIKEGRKVFPISLNFSRITLLEYNLVDEILAIQEKYDVPRELIEIEITESIGEMEREVVVGIGARIHEQGFLISLDDFGSKYTSMSILSMIPFHTLKLDRSLVEDLDGNERTRVLVKHIVEMCDDLGVCCIAEGVETAGQLNILRELHCGFVQGYYFDRPLPLEQFEQKYMVSTPPPPEVYGKE